MIENTNSISDTERAGRQGLLRKVSCLKRLSSQWIRRDLTDLVSDGVWLARGKAVVAAATRVMSCGWLADLLALGFILGFVLLFFGDAIWHSVIYYERDTLNFYYPTMARVGEALRKGPFPLFWTTSIFAGFPLFADGETGMLYPPNLIALALLSAPQAFVWSRILRFLLAAFSMYAFARTIGMERHGAVASSLVFAFGSFFVAQMHHANLANSALWLPLILCLVEKGIRTFGAKRASWLCLAGVVLGIQALGVHVQALLMTLLVLALYVPFRAMFGPVEVVRSGAAISAVGWARLKLALLEIPNRLKLIGTFLLVVPAIGLSLAAVQLVPLYELSQFSFRGQGVNYQFASSYAATVPSLISLLFPYFFHMPDNGSWSLSGNWESAIYIGIAPLVLALIGILFVRNRYCLFFLVLAILGFSLSLGAASPLRLHWYLWNLPGFSVLRAPGRFNLLFVLAGAVLAGFGLSWLLRLANRQRTLINGRSTEQTWSRGFFAVYCAGLAVLVPFVIWGLAFFHHWLVENRSEAIARIQQDYLTLSDNLFHISPDRVYNGLLYSTDLGNPKTLGSLVIMAGTVALLILWSGFWKPKRLWATGAVVLIAADLFLFGQGFHPALSLSSISDITARTAFLKEHMGLYRVFNRQPAMSLEPNRLLHIGVADFGGYSSLAPTRHESYVGRLKQGNNAFVDLAGIRYIVDENRFIPLPSYKGVSFAPRVALTSGAAGNRNARSSFSVAPTRTTAVKVVSTIENVPEIRDQTEVAEILLMGYSGERQRLVIRSGEHTAAGACENTRAGDTIKDSQASVAFTYPKIDGRGNRTQRCLYYTEIPLDKPVWVTGLEFRSLHQQAKVSLYGLTLFNNGDGSHTQVRANSKYTKVYEDPEVVIYENSSPLPRAFLVHSFKVMDPSSDILAEMAEADIDLEKTVILEETPRSLDSTRIEGLGTRSSAEITSYAPLKVTVQTDSDTDSLLLLTDSYYPGWTALVDGQPKRIYRADYLFRAVPLRKGQHTIEFIFDSPTIKLGMGISLFAFLSLLVTFGFLLRCSRYRRP